MKRPERGVVLIAFVLALLIFLPAVGIGLDGAMLYVVQERLTAAVDSAALAAARSPRPERAFPRFLAANFPPGFLGTARLESQWRPGQVIVTLEAPVYFLRLGGIQRTSLQAVGTLPLSRPAGE
jgi:hypothetical protein